MIIVVLLTVVGVICQQVYGLYQQLYLGKPWGDHPASDSVLIIMAISTIVFLSLLILLFLTLTLVTEVRDTGFYYRFPVILNKMREIRKEDIEHYSVGKYHPILDYGGWGIRIRPGRGKAFNVRGNMGVKIFLKNGKTILFGTQDVSRLEQAMRKMMNQNNL